MDSPVASELAHSLVGKTLSCVVIGSVEPDYELGRRHAQISPTEVKGSVAVRRYVDHRIGYWNIRIVTGELGQVCFCFTTAVFEIHPATYGY